MTDKRPACGGIVIDARGRILLREPSNHFGGYRWTFPKGKPNTGESPQEAALRETREETGVIAEIVADVPGEYEGDTTRNRYFLMRPTAHVLLPGWESWSVCWARLERARELIEENSEPHRGWVLEVLDAGIAVDAKFRSTHAD